jgi:hypothetical protein
MLLLLLLLGLLLLGMVQTTTSWHIRRLKSVAGQNCRSTARNLATCLPIWCMQCS